MRIQQLNYLFKDPLWVNISSFSLILFFIYLGDALLSFWVPNFLQDSLGNSFLMGLVMSFSSIVGFGADLIFPQLLRGYTVRKLLFSGIIVGFLFIFALFIGLKAPLLVVFLIAMAVWGVYYEYLGFSTQQFVADSIPLRQRSSGWAVIGIFKNLSYFLGPLMAGWLFMRGEYVFLGVTTFFVMVGFLIFSVTRKRHERPISIDPSHVNIWRELSHWKVLGTRVWPIILLSLMMGLVDATFWTTGAVWSENMAEENFWGSLILPAYQLPSLFVGFAVARLGIYQGKKKIAEQFLLMSGATLCLLWLPMPIFFYLIIVFTSSIFLGVTFPLVEAVYTDITNRMGVERKHLVGLSSSTMSLSYVVGPTLAGLIANFVGERQTFAVMGAIVAIISVILVFVTPKKLRLPESQISTWKD